MTLADGFDAAAPRYDLLTGLNPGYHRALADAARLLRPEGVVVDLGCGSGLSTRALLDAAGGPVRVVGVDASAGMLDQARAKAWPDGVTFVHARAQDLPAVLDGLGIDRVDGVLAAYLLRNVPERDRAALLDAVRERLLPGGRLVVHEYSPSGAAARGVWTAVGLGIVRPLAAIVRGNPQLYTYLWRSVLQMDSLTVLGRRLDRAGLRVDGYAPGPGWQRGILHSVRAVPGTSAARPGGAA